MLCTLSSVSLPSFFSLRPFVFSVSSVPLWLTLFLAMRTKMRRTAGQADARDGAAATHARFARAPVDAELVLVLALQPRAADVIADAGAALRDGVRQHRGNCLAQAPRLGGAQVVAAAARVQPGHEQRLVGVNVPHARHHALVEQD